MNKKTILVDCRARGRASMAHIAIRKERKAR